MRIFLIAALAVACLAIIFALQNASTIIVTIGIWQVTASLALILLLTVSLGFISGLLVSMPTTIRHNLNTRRYKRQVAELEAALDDMKQEMGQQKHLLAQANAQVAEQQTRLQEKVLPETSPQPLLSQAQDLEVAELIDDTEL